MDIIASGGGILLPGSSYSYKGTKYEYKYIEGTMDDAGLLPSYLVDAFNKRPIMVGDKKKPAAAAPPKIPPIPTTPPR
jgi:hypothetical protein